jgi:hypothetical protein
MFCRIRGFYDGYVRRIDAVLENPVFSLLAVGLLMCGIALYLGMPMIRDVSHGVRSWDSPILFTSRKGSLTVGAHPLWWDGLAIAFLLLLGILIFIYVLAARLGWLKRIPLLDSDLFQKQ